MAKFIDANKMQDFLVETNDIDDWIKYKYNADWISSFIENQPTAGVVEVKRGRWVSHHPDGSAICSVCGRKQKDVWDFDNWQNFCGHCGADMRGEEK